MSGRPQRLLFLPAISLDLLLPPHPRGHPSCGGRGGRTEERVFHCTPARARGASAAVSLPPPLTRSRPRHQGGPSSPFPQLPGCPASRAPVSCAFPRLRAWRQLPPQARPGGRPPPAKPPAPRAHLSPGRRRAPRPRCPPRGGPDPSWAAPRGPAGLLGRASAGSTSWGRSPRRRRVPGIGRGCGREGGGAGRAPARGSGRHL